MLTGLSSNNEEPKMPLDKSPPKKAFPSTSERTKNGQGLKNLGLFVVILGDLVGFTGAGVAIGYVAMTKWNAPWWVLLLSTSIGLSLAFYQLYKISQKEL